jgi:hypothetical protein
MNLTDEQLVAASKAMFAANQQSTQWQDIGSHEKQIYLGHALAAAQHLQMPWEMPRTDEVDAFRRKWKLHLDQEVLKNILWRFVEEHNEAIRPKAVDPRRDRVFRTLMCNVAGPHDLRVVTDRILAALDA